MTARRLCIVLIAVACTIAEVCAQQTWRVAGRVVDADSGRPVEYASLLLEESGLWAVSDEKGNFVVKGVPEGRHTLRVQCLGYERRSWPMTIGRDVTNLTLRLRQDNLKLDEVTVVARRRHDEATTSYSIDRRTLDNQQLMNVADVGTLLPGGKTVNPSLMNDARLSLRSGQQEKGNASFGTAIEVDGQRLDNNAMSGETVGVSTRTVGTSDIESIEVVTGIPSVEYGDLSNGIVRVHTRRGKSPFIVEGKVSQLTQQVAVNKGVQVGRGMLNASVEHARSLSDAASPHTAYERNIVSLHYSNTLWRDRRPLTLNVGVTGNVGGYDSKADPDEELDDHRRARDNVLRANVDASWLLNMKWITNLTASASVSCADQRQENYAHTSSASTQPYIHATDEGYYMAQDMADAGGGVPPIVLGPTGYWYVMSRHDSKPLSWAGKVKADWTRRLGVVTSHLMAGAQLNGSRNAGRGTWYDDMAVAPTWREYRYDRLPSMNNVALYAEEKVTVPTHRRSDASLQVTGGVRHDLTLIGGSDYGRVGSLSPRVNTRYVMWRGRRHRWVSDMQVHAGWGKSVKLPSFQVLYPQPTYADRDAFASTSDAQNRSVRAYHTHPSSARYNPSLRWQYTNQTDVGVELSVGGTRVAVSAFHHRTRRPYVQTREYTPFAYVYTPPSAIEKAVKQLGTQGIALPADERRFAIDRESGVVTMSNADGTVSMELEGTERRSYLSNSTYVNAPSPIERSGVEWTVDFAQIRALRTSLRLDGNYYSYRGLDELLFADMPSGATSTMSDGQPYQYVGYYRGTSVATAGSSAYATVANGSQTAQVNLNATLTTHVPRIRLIVALRLESTLYSYSRALSQLRHGTRGYMTDGDGSMYEGEPYDGKTRDKTVVVYPEYYSTWDEPDRLIPFAEAFIQAREDGNTALYSDLSRLVLRTNYAYTMNPNRLSRYYSANLSVTKEIGDHVSLSFYANNFFNNMKRVHSSQTDLRTSLFGSSYIPAYYYGLSLRLKI